jgi:hypothetical protein
MANYIIKSENWNFKFKLIYEKKIKPLTPALMLHVLVKQSGQWPTHKGEWKEFWQKAPTVPQKAIN